MPLMLGKREHQPGAISWRYSDIFNIKQLTKPPLVFGHIWNETKVDMLGNDSCGCCVWATMAHLVGTMRRGIGLPEAPFTDDSVISDYSTVTHYVPGDPSTDSGTYMRDGASYFRRIGLLDGKGDRHQAVAYMDLKTTDFDELMQATFDFGGIALGLKLPQSAIDQFKMQRVWDTPFRPRIVGGHCVALVGRNHFNNAVIATWNGVVGATPGFLKEFCDEAVAFVSLEYLDAKGINPRGYDRTELEKKLAALG